MASSAQVEDDPLLLVGHSPYFNFISTGSRQRKTSWASQGVIGDAGGAAVARPCLPPPASAAALLAPIPSAPAPAQPCSPSLLPPHLEQPMAVRVEDEGGEVSVKHCVGPVDHARDGGSAGSFRPLVLHVGSDSVHLAEVRRRRRRRRLPARAIGSSGEIEEPP